MRPSPRRGLVVSSLLIVSMAVTGLAAAIVPSSPALAHTDLDFTLPAEGTTVGDPISEISIGFTDQVALIGNGFDVHDPQGNLLEPFVVTDNNKVFRLQLDPPLAGGIVGVDFHVRALDGDEMTGSFSFTVAAELPTTTSTTAAPVTSPAPVTTAEPATTPPPTAPPTPPPTTVVLDATGADGSSSADDPVGQAKDDSSRNIAIVILIVVAIGCAGFVIARSRRHH